MFVWVRLCTCASNHQLRHFVRFRYASTEVSRRQRTWWQLSRAFAKARTNERTTSHSLSVRSIWRLRSKAFVVFLQRPHAGGGESRLRLQPGLRHQKEIFSGTSQNFKRNLRISSRHFGAWWRHKAFHKLPLYSVRKSFLFRFRIPFHPSLVSHWCPYYAERSFGPQWRRWSVFRTFRSCNTILSQLKKANFRENAFKSFKLYYFKGIFLFSIFFRLNFIKPPS